MNKEFNLAEIRSCRRTMRFCFLIFLLNVVALLVDIVGYQSHQSFLCAFAMGLCAFGCIMCLLDFSLAFQELRINKLILKLDEQIQEEKKSNEQSKTNIGQPSLVD